jgi:GNAT superfamily N-acetyltransferase
MTDARVAPVEENLLAQFEEIQRVGGFEAWQEDDVAGYLSDHPFPLFNAVCGARFDRGEEAQRTRTVLGRYVDRGLPFLWWATPSTPVDHATMLDVGLHHEPVPGMYVDLHDPVAGALPEGLMLEQVGPSTRQLAMETICAGFDMPDFVVGVMVGLIAGFGAEHTLTLLARLDGEPVGGGMLYLTGETAGLYSIATLASARGRGIGHAVTAALMDLGRERGCTHAVLHASDLGRPVYERLGFVEVCQVPQYVWLPPAG